MNKTASLYNATAANHALAHDGHGLSGARRHGKFARVFAVAGALGAAVWFIHHGGKGGAHDAR